MANRNSTPLVPVIPVSWLDDLQGATNRLQALQAMLTPYVIDLLGNDVRRQSVATGLFDILEDVIQTQQDLADRASSLLQSRLS